MESIMLFIGTQREELDELSGLRISRKLLRSKSSPLDPPLTKFVELFRLSKEAFAFVLEEIKDEYMPHNSNGIPIILQLAATLKFVAEGSYQKGVGQDTFIGMTQPTVSNTMSHTLFSVIETIIPPNKCCRM